MEGTRCLHRVNRSSEITFTDIDQGLEHAIILDRESFCLCYVSQPLLLTLIRDLWKSELDTSRGKWVDDLGYVVANYTESSIFTVGFDNSSQGSLSIISHWICFIKDNYLDGGYVCCRTLGNLPLRKLLDLLADNTDTALVRSVELKDSLFIEFVAKQVFGKCKDSWGFSRTWWPV